MLHWILWPSVGVVLLIGAVLLSLRLRFKKRAIALWLRADTQSDLDERNFQPKLVEDLRSIAAPSTPLCQAPSRCGATHQSPQMPSRRSASHKAPGRGPFSTRAKPQR